MIAGLRVQRNMTWRDLSHAADIAQSTINDIEQSETLKARPGTIMKVIEALHAKSPIANEDIDFLLEATGLDAAVRTATAPLRRPDIQASLAANRLRSPERATAHQWLDELMDQIGVVRVIDGLRSMASFAGIELSAPLSASDLEQFQKRKSAG